MQKSTTFLLTILKTRIFKIKVLTGSMSGKRLVLCFQDGTLLLCPWRKHTLCSHTEQRSKSLSQLTSTLSTRDLSAHVLIPKRSYLFFLPQWRFKFQCEFWSNHYGCWEERIESTKMILLVTRLWKNQDIPAACWEPCTKSLGVHSPGIG